MRVGSDSTGVLQSEGIENRQIGRAPATRQGPLHPTHFRRAGFALYGTLPSYRAMLDREGVS